RTGLTSAPNEYRPIPDAAKRGHAARERPTTTNRPAVRAVQLPVLLERDRQAALGPCDSKAAGWPRQPLFQFRQIPISLTWEAEVCDWLAPFCRERGNSLLMGLARLRVRYEQRQ